MIEIEDKDVPPGAAELTMPELMECFRAGTVTIQRGDLIFEWRCADTGDLLGRRWVWKDGVAVGDGGYNFTTVIGRALWYEKRDRLN